MLACVAGVRRGGKGERRASEVREDRTREDCGRGPSPSLAHFDFPPSLSTTFLPPFLRPATQARLMYTCHVLQQQNTRHTLTVTYRYQIYLLVARVPGRDARILLMTFRLTLVHSTAPFPGCMHLQIRSDRSLVRTFHSIQSDRSKKNCLIVPSTIIWLY